MQNYPLTESQHEDLIAQVEARVRRLEAGGGWARAAGSARMGFKGR
jgi:hypothetical protein